ncbi:hypothetical protein SUGI_0318430 [Cryptomeria japonica]|nr:hypothetical protein SUGI_0318430 [Cryptomeria japonica]
MKIGQATNNEAELMGNLRGLRLCSKHGIDEIEIEGDSQLNINAVCKVTFGVKCICAQSNDLVETLEEQVARLFQKGNEEKLMVIKVLGTNFWAKSHIHHGAVYENRFAPIVQVLGYFVNAYGIVATVREENAIEVKTALESLEIVTQSKIMLGFFDLSAERKKIKMAKAWKLYKVGVGSRYNLDEFLAFMGKKEELLPVEIVDRLKEIGEGIDYLYH